MCQFAQSEYKDASATPHEVLADGPGWDWGTVSSFYTSVDAYTKQLRALERYVTANRSDSAVRFVLAYQYLVIDSRDVAVNQFQEVVKLQPEDKLSTDIVQAFKKAKGDKLTKKP